MDSYPTKSHPGQKKGKASGNPRLLDELIIEILLRLPVLSLLRCTLVCRGWKAIIKSPSFIRDHFRMGSRFTSNLVHWQYYNGEQKFGDNNLCSIFPDGTSERYEVPPLSGQYYEMHGACNGIICVSGKDGIIYLWNPAIRKSRPLPPCPYIGSRTIYEIGIGSDHITDDLKIFLISAWGTERRFFVYSSAEESWKAFEDDVLSDNGFWLMDNHLGRTFLNGVYYWIKFHLFGDAKKTRLLAFDMHNYSFQEVEMPQTNKDEKAAIDIFDNTLALIVCKREHPLPITIWLMKETGCLTKHKTVSVSPFISIVRQWKGNQIYLDTVEDLILYDLDSGLFKSLGKRAFSTFVYRYKESLLLLN